MSHAQEDGWHIEAEKMLCDALGRPWTVTGISIETLCAEVKRRLQSEAEPVKHTKGALLTGAQAGRIASLFVDEDATGQNPLWCALLEIANGRHTVVASDELAILRKASALPPSMQPWIDSLAERLAAPVSQEAALRDALEYSVVAIDDWLNTYAPEQACMAQAAARRRTTAQLKQDREVLVAALREIAASEIPEAVDIVYAARAAIAKVQP